MNQENQGELILNASEPEPPIQAGESSGYFERLAGFICRPSLWRRASGMSTPRVWWPIFTLGLLTSVIAGALNWWVVGDTLTTLADRFEREFEPLVVENGQLRWRDAREPGQGSVRAAILTATGELVFLSDWDASVVSEWEKSRFRFSLVVDPRGMLQDPTFLANSGVLLSRGFFQEWGPEGSLQYKSWHDFLTASGKERMEIDARAIRGLLENGKMGVNVFVMLVAAGTLIAWFLCPLMGFLAGGIPHVFRGRGDDRTFEESFRVALAVTAPFLVLGLLLPILERFGFSLPVWIGPVLFLLGVLVLAFVYYGNDSKSSVSSEENNSITT